MPHSIPRRGSRRTVYRALWKRLAAGLLDLLGTIAVRLVTLGRGLKPDPEILGDPRNILVVRLDHIGDVLFARPSLAALRAAYPRARITALVSSVGRELLAADENVDEVMAWDAPWFARRQAPRRGPGRGAILSQIRSRRFDLSLDLRGDFRHHVLLALAGVKTRVGYGITGGAWLLHVPLRLRVGVHEVERDLDVVRALGQAAAATGYAPISLTPEEQAFGKKSWSGSGCRVAVHPTAGDPRKCWPPERFAGICRQLADQGCEVILVGTKADRDRAEKIAGLSGSPLKVLTGQTTLRQLAGLLSEADLLLGNDSGPAHLALTQGVPAIMIWSETNTAEEWGPWGKSAEGVVIRHPGRPEAEPETLAAARRLLGRSGRAPEGVNPQA